MGLTSSVSKYSNDFELVVRSTKEMEHLLETKFGAPSGKHGVGLHDKISAARDPKGNALPDRVVRKMRYLVTIRNKLVHEQGFDAIPERGKFAASFTEIEKELRVLAGADEKSCAIS